MPHRFEGVPHVRRSETDRTLRSVTAETVVGSGGVDILATEVGEKTKWSLATLDTTPNP